MTLLAIDIGNTNVHYGLYNQDMGDWCCSWRGQTVHHRMSDEYAVLLRNFFTEHGFTFADIDDVVMASVVPALTPAFIEMSERYLDTTPLNITADTDTGVKIKVDNPAEVGPDRIVNTAAVHAAGKSPAIVIDFGTATTYDVISRKGHYLGGAIAPGIGLAHDALINRTSRLLKVELAPPPTIIGSNTIHALQSGIFMGYVAMIEGLVSRIKTELGEPDTCVIATGGLAPLFAEYTDSIEELAPNLTLDGLYVIWKLHQKT